MIIKIISAIQGVLFLVLIVFSLSLARFQDGLKAENTQLKSDLAHAVAVNVRLEARHHAELEAIAREAGEARVRASALEEKKDTVRHAEDACTPALRSALDGVRELRAAASGRP